MAFRENSLQQTGAEADGKQTCHIPLHPDKLQSSLDYDQMWERAARDSGLHNDAVSRWPAALTRRD